MSDSTCQQEPCVCERRILVVDNDRYDCADHVKCLHDWGFQHVYAAEGKGQALLQNAVETAQRHRCHLALVDMRLLDNYDVTDHSGLTLLPQLQPTRTILVTAYGDMQIGVKALQQHGAVNAVGKQEGPDRLRQAVYEALGSLCGRRLEIQWPAGWDPERVAQALALDEQTDAASGAPQDASAAAKSIDTDEVCDVLIQLFPGVSQLKLQHLNGAKETPMKRPGRRQSLVFIAHADQRAPVIVKLAHAERVQSEVENYRQYVDHRVQSFKCAQLRQSSVLWRIGGLAYALIGGDQVSTYTERYRQVPDVETALKPLREHFCETWYENYKQSDHQEPAGQPPEPASLLEIYYHAWAEELEMLQMAHSLDSLLSRWLLQLDYLALQQPTPMRIPNPYRWIAERREKATFPHLRKAIIHGDLHGNNIMVDTDNHPWIIDYDRTRQGYLLFDMTEIMQYLLTRIADLHIHNPAFYELAVALADFTQPALRLSAGIFNDSEAHKAHQMLDALRTTASYLDMYDDEREILWGILLEAVFVSLIIPHDPERGQKMQLLGGVICQRLENWSTDDWIPAHWPPIEWLDAES